VRIIIPKYAKERIKTYNLTEELIENTLKNPDEIVKGYEGRLIAHKLLNGHILRVVYSETKDEIKVITVYPARKERYWREK
jgi:hypothetical protein